MIEQTQFPFDDIEIKSKKNSHVFLVILVILIVWGSLYVYKTKLKRSNKSPE